MESLQPRCCAERKHVRASPTAHYASVAGACGATRGAAQQRRSPTQAIPSQSGHHHLLLPRLRQSLAGSAPCGVRRSILDERRLPSRFSAFTANDGWAAIQQCVHVCHPSIWAFYNPINSLGASATVCRHGSTYCTRRCTCSIPCPGDRTEGSARPGVGQSGCANAWSNLNRSLFLCCASGSAFVDIGIAHERVKDASWTTVFATVVRAGDDDE